MATNGNINHSDQFGPASTATSTGSAAPAVDQASNSTSGNNLGKDEVAWFFVEQYYTTLSKTPEKLHLFYGKRSQFVYGKEAQVANVSVGRQTIQERIKELDFQDCKVRVSNVDSQASFENIVIQVIGETSNKAGDPKKFVQTFVLAQQPSGYFVLNDILRYIDEDGDEESTEAAARPTEGGSVEFSALAPAEVKEEPELAETESVAEEPASLDAGVIDQKLEEAGATTEDTASANGDSVAETSAEEVPAVPETASKPVEEAAPDPEVTAQELAEEEIRETEKPTDPAPTPVAARKPAPPVAAPPGPPKPMTWASRAAAAAGPRPVVPLPKTATPPTTARSAAPTQPAAPQAAPQAASQAAAAPAQSTEPAASATPAKEAPTEWQTAGSDSKRQNRPQSISGPLSDKDGTMGYVKYVTDKVKNEELKAALAQHGELVYFDINRQKNCAFVEFANAAGYQAAVAANPHTVNGETIVVEPRRPKAGAYGGSNYTATRGGSMPNRGGRGGFDGRSGSQGGRGNFGSQGRGRGGMPRGGRGASQATNA
ncbi:Uu.00g004300.m01.CDS01 [Anthostomella pinea]|uniref:Uu.00g004300.m01.CDS01 n=1 Tax=Anthostomella pinea TaxID=933095 RepID=A0AAI8YIS5_9PEZI|nr:Uu.00g004300.m01.CDS01 [Anthostomella pinea]